MKRFQTAVEGLVEYPNQVHLHILYSNILKDTGGLPQALAHLVSIFNSFKKDFSYLIQLGRLFQKSGEIGRAHKLFMDASRQSASQHQRFQALRLAALS